MIDLKTIGRTRARARVTSVRDSSLDTECADSNRKKHAKETMDASAIERAIDAVSSLDELARVRFTRRSRLRSRRKTVGKERVDVIQRRRED
jgi:hypothetical protein